MSGHQPWSKVRADTARTPEREARVTEMKKAAETAYQLAQLRAERATTQVLVAQALGTSQANVSRIEHQGDLYVSTLRGYVEALGGRLELNAVFPDGMSMILDGGNNVFTTAKAAQSHGSGAVRRRGKSTVCR